MNLVISHRPGLEHLAMTIRLNGPKHIPPAAKIERVCKPLDGFIPTIEFVDGIEDLHAATPRETTLRSG